jgi:hypothetical protein
MSLTEFTPCSECTSPMACRDMAWCHNSKPPKHEFMERVHSEVCHLCLKTRADPIHFTSIRPSGQRRSKSAP